MNDSVEKLNLIKNKIKKIVIEEKLKTTPQIIAVSKTFPLDKIIPLLESGHFHYGENKIQEAETKWDGIKNKHKNLQLHMLGKLQSNKAKKAVKLFDYIHSLDSFKLALKISQFQKELNKQVKLFIQINIANEIKKSGILLNDLNQFYKYCTKELSLNIIGLMILPPADSKPNKYFEIIKQSSETLNLADISMGMSADYEDAIKNGSTYLRLGTAIFGERNI